MDKLDLKDMAREGKKFKSDNFNAPVEEENCIVLNQNQINLLIKSSTDLKGAIGKMIDEWSNSFGFHRVDVEELEDLKMKIDRVSIIVNKYLQGARKNRFFSKDEGYCGSEDERGELSYESFLKSIEELETYNGKTGEIPASVISAPIRALASMIHSEDIRNKMEKDKCSIKHSEYVSDIKDALSLK